MHNEPSGMGKSIVINGELSACEDLTVDGCVEGKIQLRDHVLTVGSNGRIKAQVTARAIVVFGQVTGNLIATEKVDIKETGSVEGDIVAPRVAIADGSHFRGTIDMQKRDQSIAVDRSIDGFETDSKTPKPEPSSVNGEFARI
jgi:cytoskeletal protein CcmA (bactofilin family)